MAKDMHKSDFDQGTKIKLELLKKYLIEWFPVALNTSRAQPKLFDFFSGSGSDISGEPGSPIIMLNFLIAQCAMIREKGKTADLIFNDISRQKTDELQKKCDALKASCRIGKNCQLGCPFSISINNDTFKSLFLGKYREHFNGTDSFSFLFIDQYGIKEVNKEVFKRLSQLQRSDILFFISSAHAFRFKDNPEFNAYLDLNKLDFQSHNYNDCHRIICKYYRTLVPESVRFYLAPFSIRKPDSGNIHGLIFGSGNLLGIEKFLQVAWNIDPSTGESNYDIDDDGIVNGEMALFADEIKPKKIQKFEETLLSYIGQERTNQEIYEFVITNGFLPKHANTVLRSKALNGRIVVRSLDGRSIRKGYFYINHRPEKTVKVKYEHD